MARKGETPGAWALVRRWAQVRSSLAVLAALVALSIPFVPDIHELCEEVEVSFSGKIAVWTACLSLICLGLVLISQMKWWLTAPFLSRVRWHILLDSMNVWLFHFLACHPSCGRDALSGLSLLAIASVIFLWLNKLMGFTIIKHHLAMLEKAFARSLCSVMLDLLLYLFGIAISVSSICFLAWYWLVNQWLIQVVIFMETVPRMLFLGHLGSKMLDRHCLQLLIQVGGSIVSPDLLATGLRLLLGTSLCQDGSFRSLQARREGAGAESRASALF